MISDFVGYPYVMTRKLNKTVGQKYFWGSLYQPNTYYMMIFHLVELKILDIKFFEWCTILFVCVVEALSK